MYYIEILGVLDVTCKLIGFDSVVCTLILFYCTCYSFVPSPGVWLANSHCSQTLTYLVDIHQKMNNQDNSWKYWCSINFLNILYRILSRCLTFTIEIFFELYNLKYTV